VGTIDIGAHLEPVEAMVEAAWHLCSRPPVALSGRSVLNPDRLRELGVEIRTLDGRRVLQQ